MHLRIISRFFFGIFKSCPRLGLNGVFKDFAINFHLTDPKFEKKKHMYFPIISVYFVEFSNVDPIFDKIQTFFKV